ncbi:hypothetical protein Q31a_19060 [Aureliella helgolandensis]|uniref:Uncharacterized protein n=1 Tax=Aureliella helgolandensis TaxID=2527968 RepID=A0A518G4T0_9BACT|nr:hypothetical protein Q31a_19060 [Aureliella helgolandensis]
MENLSRVPGYAYRSAYEADDESMDTLADSGSHVGLRSMATQIDVRTIKRSG